MTTHMPGLGMSTAMAAPIVSGSASYGTSINQSTSFALGDLDDLTFTVTDKDAGYDDDTVTIEVLNKPPVCTIATPSTPTIWPVNHNSWRSMCLG